MSSLSAPQLQVVAKLQLVVIKVLSMHVCVLDGVCARASGESRVVWKCLGPLSALGLMGNGWKVPGQRADPWQLHGGVCFSLRWVHEHTDEFHLVLIYSNKEEDLYLLKLSLQL